MGYSKRNIALSVPCSRNTAARVADRADELQLKWPLPETYTDGALEKLLFPKETPRNSQIKRQVMWGTAKNWKLPVENSDFLLQVNLSQTARQGLSARIR